MVKQFAGEHRWLSNFWPAEVRWGMLFPTVEHAYQAAKCVRKADMVQFRTGQPGAAKRLGRTVEMRPDWMAVRVQVMEYLLRQKFTAGTELADKLVATGDQMLQEGNTWGDTFWGVSLATGQGQNTLGKLLMQIRSEQQAAG